MNQAERREAIKQIRQLTAIDKVEIGEGEEHA